MLIPFISAVSPQAAMCYVHVAALIAEYLHRKSKPVADSLITMYFLQQTIGTGTFNFFACSHCVFLARLYFILSTCSKTGFKEKLCSLDEYIVVMNETRLQNLTVFLIFIYFFIGR